MRLRAVQKSKVKRHLEEALQEGASAAVLRTALVAAEQANCKDAVTESASAALARVETSEAAAASKRLAAPRHPTLLGGGLGSFARKAEPERSRPDLAGAVAHCLATRKLPVKLKKDAPKNKESDMTTGRVAAVRDMTAANSFAALRKAICAARAAQVSICVLEPFEQRLAAAVKIRQALEWALVVGDVAAIGEAVKRREEGMLDAAQVGRAEAVLAEEHSKAALLTRLHLARQKAGAAAASSSSDRVATSAAFGAAADRLRGLIEAGRRLSIKERELAVFEKGLAQDERKMSARYQMWTVMLEATSLDVKEAELEQLAALKKRLREALVEASAAGLPEPEVLALDGERRRVHNAIEARRGAVRVHCRVRPLSPAEAAAGERPAVRCRDGFGVEVEFGQCRPESDGSPQNAHRRLPSERSEGDVGGAVAFDSCWAPGSQEEVFEDMRDLVQSAVDGYNVTVFAYGQTGAGKTHTMYGSLELPKALARKSSRSILPGSVGPEPWSDADELRGICPRTTEEVFRIIGRDRGRFSFTVSFSMVELYCQRFIDLLDPSSDRPLKVRTTPGGEVFLENAKEQILRRASDLGPLLRAGLAARHVRNTSQNAESSRSHVLFTLKIASVNHETGQMTRGKITLVDLAGSERIKRSDVRGPGLKEAIEINRSLTALADVVGALARGDKHVPYRNHELTQVMHDALGGQAKTLMLVNLSPLACHSEETLCSVKFAKRVKGAVSSDLRRSRPELRPAFSAP